MLTALQKQTILLHSSHFVPSGRALRPHLTVCADKGLPPNPNALSSQPPGPTESSCVGHFLRPWTLTSHSFSPGSLASVLTHSYPKQAAQMNRKAGGGAGFQPWPCHLLVGEQVTSLLWAIVPLEKNGIISASQGLTDIKYDKIATSPEVANKEGKKENNDNMVQHHGW